MFERRLDSGKTVFYYRTYDECVENYAIVLTLVTSGLRASELCQLSWSDLYYEDGRYTAYFTGKRRKAAEQELYPASVTAASDYFKAQFERIPNPGDHFFYNLENYKGRILAPLKMPTPWASISLRSA